MTTVEFESALTEQLPTLTRYFGDDGAQDAIESAINQGHDAFADSDKLRNYLFFSAKRDQMTATAKAFRRFEIMRYYKHFMPRAIKHNKDAILDVDSATSDLEPGMRAAVTSYLLDDSTLYEAAGYLDNRIPESTRAFKVQRVINKLTGPKGKLQAYAKAK